MVVSFVLRCIIVYDSIEDLIHFGKAGAVLFVYLVDDDCQRVALLLPAAGLAGNRAETGVGFFFKDSFLIAGFKRFAISSERNLQSPKQRYLSFRASCGSDGTTSARLSLRTASCLRTSCAAAARRSRSGVLFGHDQHPIFIAVEGCRQSFSRIVSPERVLLSFSSV